MNFTFSKRARTFTLVLIVLGAVGTLIGILGDQSSHYQRTWSNLLINGFFFFGISMGALFFYTLQSATETAWSVLVKRVYEGIYGALPLGVIALIVVFIGASLHMNHIYHWMDSTLYHEYMVMDGDKVLPAEATDAGAVLNPNYDSLMAGKEAYLNVPFFWIRTLVYIAVFMFFANWFRKKSLEMDRLTGDSLLRTHLLTYRRSALFLVFFAVFSSTLSWDWLMSIDAHWFSTMYGWYVFSGMWVSAMVVGVILVLYLKRKGHLPQVNNSHILDMGKWVFAISFLWSYLWFSQFMLIWYSNIPEEVTYFMERIDNHPGLLWTIFAINFVVPMILLMSRDAKRNPRFLILVGTVIFIGHWLDTLLLVLPGTLGRQFLGIGLLEVGMFVLFLGIFISRVLSTLTKAPLTPVNHPYLEESVHHQI